MSAVVVYEEIYGENGEKFERLLKQLLNEVAANSEWRAFENAETLKKATESLILKIDNLSFMVMLSAKDGVPIPAELIAQLRDIYSRLNDELLEKPAMALLEPEVRKKIELTCVELASAICALDMSRSGKVAAVFSGRKIYA